MRQKSSAEGLFEGTVESLKMKISIYNTSTVQIFIQVLLVQEDVLLLFKRTVIRSRLSIKDEIKSKLPVFDMIVVNNKSSLNYFMWTNKFFSRG